MSWLAGNRESFVGEIADAGCEAKDQQVAESEDVVCRTRGIGRVFFDPQIGPILKQTVEDVGRVANYGVDDFGMGRHVLLGDMRLEVDSWPIAILRIQLAGCFAAAAGAKALAV